MNIVKRLSTHSGRFERLVGKETLEMWSKQMKHWYGPPIAVADVPGNIWMCPGGDFRGIIRAGQYMSAVDIGVERLKKAWKVAAQRAMIQQNAGFASLSDIISEATSGGKMRRFDFYKALGTVTASASTIQFVWGRNGQPSTGAAPAAAAAGTAFSKSSAGAFPFTNPASGDTQHLVSAAMVSSSGTATNLLLYDQLYGVAKLINSTNNEAVTGVPTRYQSQTATDPDYIGGNFLFITVGSTTVPNTAHNWTACTYTNQTGAGATLPDVTGFTSHNPQILELDHPFWYVPLASGDVGIGALTNMHCDALVASGTIWFIMGHPIAVLLMAGAHLMTFYDGINRPLNLPRIMDNACLSFLEFQIGGAGPNVAGSFITVSG